MWNYGAEQVFVRASSNIPLFSEGPHYFAVDFPKYRRVTHETEYLGLFSAAGPHHKALCEASVYYLYSGQALERIKRFDNEAKVIVMPRNPVDLVYSPHSQLLYSCNEDEKDFAKAWQTAGRASERSAPPQAMPGSQGAAVRGGRQAREAM